MMSLDCLGWKRAQKPEIDHYTVHQLKETYLNLVSQDFFEKSPKKFTWTETLDLNIRCLFISNSVRKPNKKP